MYIFFEEAVKAGLKKALEELEKGGKTDDKLELGKEISTSPLIRIIGIDDTANTFTVLMRGNMQLIKGLQSVFMRLEFVVSRTDPIRILEWLTIMGEITIGNEGLIDKPSDRLFIAKMGIGYDHGRWVGRGVLKVLPPFGWGMDVFLGGLEQDRMLIGLGIGGRSSNVPIPLGATGLGFSYFGGDFALNYKPNLNFTDDPKKKDVTPNAVDYVKWARGTELDRWDLKNPVPINETAIGLGVRCKMVDITTSGMVMEIDPLGLAVLIPGPVIIFGGKGKMLQTNSAVIEGQVALDIASATLAFGFHVEMKFPANGSLVSSEGTLDALFSFTKPLIWYINFGTKDSPIRAKILKGLVGGDIYVNFGNCYTSFGAAISIGGSWTFFDFITFIARVHGGTAVLLGYNPSWRIAGAFKIWGEAGFMINIRIWKFKFLFSIGIEFVANTPDPTRFAGKFTLNLNNPWPIPDLDLTIPFPDYSDPAPDAPKLVSPMLVGDVKWD